MNTHLNTDRTYIDFSSTKWFYKAWTYHVWCLLHTLDNKCNSFTEFNLELDQDFYKIF